MEAMRQDFETELQAARTEVAKAQDALKTAEDRVRCSERIEMAKMEAEYQMRLSSLGNELERVREELIIRTQTLGDEMERCFMCFCTSTGAFTFDYYTVHLCRQYSMS